MSCSLKYFLLQTPFSRDSFRCLRRRVMKTNIAMMNSTNMPTIIPAIRGAWDVDLAFCVALDEAALELEGVVEDDTSDDEEVVEEVFETLVKSWEPATINGSDEVEELESRRKTKLFKMTSPTPCVLFLDPLWMTFS